MVNSIKAKTGRKAKPYTTSWGEIVPGLYRCPDGRWRITATGAKFTEADERLAVARYRQLAGGDVLKIRSRVAAGNVPQRIAEGTTIEVQCPPAQLWAWLRQQIVERPQWVAQQIGIEQIGYLSELEKPQPSPTLDEVGQLYLDKAECEPHWRTKVETIWDEFKRIVNVPTLRDLQQSHLITYRDRVKGKAKSATYVKHRYGAVKSVLRYPTKQGLWSTDCTRALSFAAVLVPPNSTSIAPDPMGPEAFQTLLSHASNQLKAILLVALNCAMYADEVSDLRWTDLDLQRGTLSMVRRKTDVPRVAVLWPRTVEALKQLPRGEDDVVWRTEFGYLHNANTIRKAFEDLRTLAKLPTAKFSQLRDSAYTAACEAGIPLEAVKALAGHKTGISDRYLRRSPRLVSAACEAVESEYFGR